MQLTHPIARLSYSFSKPVRSRAAAKAMVKAGPALMPARIGPMNAIRLLGIELMISEATMPSPAMIMILLGFFDWS